jgi:hypothetical protein
MTISEQRGGTPPGELARLTAERLAAAGITVTQDGTGPDLELELHPGPDPRPGDRPGQADAVRWTLAVDDNARARLDFAPAPGGTGDPGRVAGIAAALLTGSHTADGPPDDGPGPATPGDGPGPVGGIMRAAGLDLRRRDFTVRLNAYTDNECLELSCDLSVTAPGDDPNEPATAYIAADGTIQFERSYWAGYAAPEWEPGHRIWLPGPAAPARAIAGTIIAAIAAAQPLEAGR